VALPYEGGSGKLGTSGGTEPVNDGRDEFSDGAGAWEEGALSSA
jgi:hypothetical protein